MHILVLKHPHFQGIVNDLWKEFLLFHSCHTFDPYFYFNSIFAGDAIRSEDWKEKHMSLLRILMAQPGCILHNLHSVFCLLKHQWADCIAQNRCCIIGSVSGGYWKRDLMWQSLHRAWWLNISHLHGAIFVKQTVHTHTYIYIIHLIFHPICQCLEASERPRFHGFVDD